MTRPRARKTSAKRYHAHPVGSPPHPLKGLKGMRLFMESRKATEGYVITQRRDDFKVLDVTSAKRGVDAQHTIGRIASIAAPLACYWSEPPSRTEQPGE